MKKFFKKKMKKKDSKKKNSLVKVMKKVSRTRNPKCKKKKIKGFRGTDIEEDESIFRPLLCHKEMCRSKERIPDKRIYKERTLEFGIVVDKYLFHEMKVELYIKYSQHNPVKILFSQQQISIMMKKLRMHC